MLLLFGMVLVVVGIVVVAAAVVEGLPHWTSGKASASRAEDPVFESPLRRDFFGVKSSQ